MKVGFFKPIAQPHPGDVGPERSTELVARTHGLKPPTPLGLAHVERMLGDGQLDELLEEIISLYQEAAIGKDVLIVEGMVPTRTASYAARVNLHLAKSLDAEVILVSAPENEVLTELSGRVELQAQLFGGPKDPKVLGVILNKVRTDESMDVFAARLKEHSPLLRSGDFRLLGNHPPGMARQLRQHRVLLARQSHFRTVQQYPPIRQVHRQRSKAQCRFLGFPRRCLA